MKKWLLPIGSLTAIAVALVAVLAVAGVFDGDDANSVEGPEAAGLCIEGQPDCVDTVVDGDTADDEEGGGDAVNQVCAPGEPNCVDTDVGDGLEQTCLAGTEDCNDADLSGGTGEGDGSGDGTSIAPVCAPGFPDCADTVVVTNGDGDPDGPSE